MLHALCETGPVALVQHRQITSFEIVHLQACFRISAQKKVELIRYKQNS